MICDDGSVKGRLIGLLGVGRGQIIAERRFGKGVYAQHADGLLAQRDRLHVGIDDGGAGPQAEVDAHLAVQVGGQAARPAHNLVRGPPGDALRAQVEGAGGGAIR